MYALVALAASLSSATAPAATLTWVGGSGNWNTTSLNWSGTTWSNIVPDDAVFASSAGTVTLTENITSGTITATTTNYTLASSSTFGLTVSRIDISSLNANGTLTLNAKLTGNSGLSLAGAGDITNTGNGNTNTGIRLTNTSNDFIGDVTITNRLASYTNNAVFGNAANKIIMNGGGILDNVANGSLLRNIEVQSGGGIIRVWNNTTTWSGSLTGSGAVSRIDTGTLNLSGDLSGYSGTFTQNGGGQSITTNITGSGTVGGNWTNSQGTFTFNSASNQTATGTLSGAFTKSGAGILTLANATVGGNWTVNTGGGLNIQSNSAQSMAGAISGTGSVAKNGTGALTVTAQSSFTGPLTITGGTWSVNVSANNTNPTATGLGDMQQAARSVIVNSGATLAFVANDCIGQFNHKALTTLTADGGTITKTGAANFLSLGDVVLRNGGRLTSRNGSRSDVQSFALNGTITASGTSGSFMDASGSTFVGMHLGTVGGTTAFNVNATGDATADLTVSAPLVDRATGGAGALLKTGAGRMVLSGANTFTGNVTITGGTVNVSISANNASPTATGLGNMTTIGKTVTTSTGATLNFVSEDVMGNYSYVTPVTLIADGGTITRQSTATVYFNSLGNVELRNGGRLRTNNGNNAGVQSFGLNGGLTVSGTSGSFIDTVGSSFNGINLGNNTVSYSGTTTFTVNSTGDANADLAVSAPLGDRTLGGASILVKAGSGLMRVSSANAYSGGTILRAGTIVAVNNNALSTAGTVTINDANTGTSDTSLLIGGSFTIARAISVANQGTGSVTIGSTGLTTGNQAIFSGAITLAKDVTFLGASGGDRTQFSGGIGGTGNVTIAGAGRTIYNTTANTYAGATTISGTSTLQLSDGATTTTSFLPDNQPVTVNGVLSLAKGTNSETVGGLFGAGTVQNLVVGVTSTLIVGGGDASGTFNGLLANPSGTLAIEKIGAGTQVLTGSSSYTGATTISGGRLVAGNANAFGTVGTVTIGSSATLGIADGVTFSRPLTINAGGKVRTGDNSTVALPSAAALSAWESENTAGGDQTYAQILSGSGATVPSALTTAWTSNPNTSLYLSDILSLEGTGAGNVYVLSMTYSSIFGDMNIWYREDESSPFAPLGTIPMGEQAWNSSFATVGQYGLDTTAGTVWVVTDHNSQFVIVPEPGTLALTAVGLAGAAVGLRRRRRMSWRS